ncbi:MAG TPA: hypothetical protein VFP91_04475 [Vicinamibacterales bacterium]|nr:hypothetical protein [Vicinamibacterales bacterium]
MIVKRIAGSVAAIFLVGAAAFAQSDNRSTAKDQNQVAQPSSDGNATMTLVGCLVRETDYRKAHGLGKGAIGGLGLGDEFVLVDVTTVAASGSTAPATGSSPQVPPTRSSSAACSEKGTGKAYRTTGQLEERLKPFVGRRIEVTGQFDHERDARTAAGETNAKLPPEIKIASYREAPAAAGEVSKSANAAPAATPTPVPSNPQTVASNQTPTERRLPNTAGNEPLFALIGAMCLSGALGLRLLRLRSA